MRADTIKVDELSVFQKKNLKRLACQLKQEMLVLVFKFKIEITRVQNSLVKIANQHM